MMMRYSQRQQHPAKQPTPSQIGVAPLSSDVMLWAYSPSELQKSQPTV
jgi:hypothetical protein